MLERFVIGVAGDTLVIEDFRGPILGVDVKTRAITWRPDHDPKDTKTYQFGYVFGADAFVATTTRDPLAISIERFDATTGKTG